MLPGIFGVMRKEGVDFLAGGRIEGEGEIGRRGEVEAVGCLGPGGVFQLAALLGVQAALGQLGENVAAGIFATEKPAGITGFIGVEGEEIFGRLDEDAAVGHVAPRAG